MSKTKVSTKTIDDALKIAKGTAKPGQTKEQTKIIAQGIEKGIAEYKKREKAKARERDKARKKQSNSSPVVEQPIEQPSPEAKTAWLPWTLLGLSWLGFIVYTRLI